MPIGIKYQVDPAVSLPMAYEAGLGRFLQAEDQFQEQQQQFDERMGLDYAQLAENQRQFDSGLRYKYDIANRAEDQSLFEAAGRRAAAREEMAFRAADRQQSIEADLIARQMGNQAELAREEMRQRGFSQMREQESQAAKMREAGLMSRHQQTMAAKERERADRLNMGRARNIYDQFANGKISPELYGAEAQRWERETGLQWPHAVNPDADDPQVKAREEVKRLGSSFMGDSFTDAHADAISQIEDPAVRIKMVMDIAAVEEAKKQDALDRQHKIRLEEIKQRGAEEKAQQAAEAKKTQNLKARIEKQRGEASKYLSELREWRYQKEQHDSFTPDPTGVSDTKQPPDPGLPPSPLGATSIPAKYLRVDWNQPQTPEQKQKFRDEVAAMPEGTFFWYYNEVDGKPDTSTPVIYFIQDGRPVKYRLGMDTPSLDDSEPAIEVPEEPQEPTPKRYSTAIGPGYAR